MCGIAGLLFDRPRDDVHLCLGRMQEALRHRGPDGRGQFISPLGSCGLVHTRLSVMDLSAAGHQPMCLRGVGGGDRYWITFNGEIYNFRELREELVGVGVEFRSQTDTEVLLRLYEREGPSCVDRLRGMFAFAIWDELEQTCFIARDALGIKPLYYHAGDGQLIFASELRALLASDLLPRHLSVSGVFGFFRTGSVPEPQTLIEGVYVLPAGHWMVWKDGKVTQNCFWAIHFPTKCGEATGGVREALLASVRAHFVSDVPVGMFLSGGIDSTALLALARISGKKEIRTFSISFDDPNLNEGEVARHTAEYFKTDHVELRLNAQLGRELFEEFLPCLDQPTIDGFNTFAVSKFARSRGMKVVLSGVGGDELFGGYPSFRQIPMMVKWGQRLSIIEPLRNLLGYALSAGPSGPNRRLGEFLQGVPTETSAYQAYRGIYSEREALQLASQFTGVKPVAGLATPDGKEPTVGDEVSKLELERYMRNQLLRDSDVMSMAVGLELRVPLVDRPLFEVVSQVPSARRLTSGKRMLLDAVPEIPAWVAGQPKRGFVFPFDRWFAGEWKGMFENSIKVNGVTPTSWYQKWSLFVFKDWCMRTGVKLGGQEV